VVLEEDREKDWQEQGRGASEGAVIFAAERFAREALWDTVTRGLLTRKKRWKRSAERSAESATRTWQIGYGSRTGGLA
jgi:hypothetical protein